MFGAWRPAGTGDERNRDICRAVLRPHRLGPKLETPLRTFLRTEAGSAAVLLAGTLGALIWANVDLPSYDSVWTTQLSIRVGHHGLSQDLHGDG